MVVVALGLSVAAAVIGNAFLPLLLRRSPALLLAVQSSYAQMGLASPRMDPVTFVAVAALRRWVGEVIAFLAGRVLGADALRRYQRRAGGPVRLPAALAAPRSPLRDAAVVLLPHPLLAALLGAAGMPPVRYVVLKLVGSVLTVAAFRAAAGTVSTPLAAAGAFLDANVVVLTVVGAFGVAVWLARRRGAVGGPGAGGGASASDDAGLPERDDDGSPR